MPSLACHCGLILPTSSAGGEVAEVGRTYLHDCASESDESVVRMHWSCALVHGVCSGCGGRVRDCSYCDRANAAFKCGSCYGPAFCDVGCLRKSQHWGGPACVYLEQFLRLQSDGAALVDLLVTEDIPSNESWTLADSCCRMSEKVRALVKCMRVSAATRDAVRARQRELFIDPLCEFARVMTSITSVTEKDMDLSSRLVSTLATALWMMTSITGCFSDGSAAAENAERAVGALVKCASLLARHAPSMRSAAVALNTILSAAWCIASVSPVRKAVLLPVIDDLAAYALPDECIDSVAEFCRYLSTGSAARCLHLLDSGILSAFTKMNENQTRRPTVKTIRGFIASASTFMNVLWSNIELGSLDDDSYSSFFQDQARLHITEYYELHKLKTEWSILRLERDDNKISSSLALLRDAIDAEVRTLVLLNSRRRISTDDLLDAYPAPIDAHVDPLSAQLRTMLEIRRAHGLSRTSASVQRKFQRGPALAATLRIDLSRVTACLAHPHALKAFSEQDGVNGVLSMCDGCLALSTSGARCAACSFDLCNTCRELLRALGVVLV